MASTGETKKPEVNAFIRGLRTDGVEHSRGSFSLDREKAREKMRQFQLADPHEYVLELVQAAVLMGATRIRFDIDADDMWMRFDGRPFSQEDFDGLYGSLFAREHTPQNDARRELALGTNAAMALNPRYVRAVSGDGKQGAWLELRPGQDDTFGELEEPVLGTEIHVKSRFRPGLMVQFVQNLKGVLPEEETLRRRCSLSQVAIDLEGKVLSQGLSLPGAVGVVKLEGEGVTGLAGFDPQRKKGALLTLVKDGVLITRHELKASADGFVAVVDAQALRKDVSQGDIVRDQAYERLLAKLRDAGQRSLIQICRSVQQAEASVVADGPSTGMHVAQDGIPLGWARVLLKSIVAQAALEHFSTEDAEQLPYHVGRTPLFETITGSRASLQQLLVSEAKGQGHVRYASKSYGRYAHDEALSARALSGQGTVLRLIKESTDHKSLRQLLGKQLVDVTRWLDDRIQAELNRRQWRSRPAEPLLAASPDEGQFLVKQPVEAKGVKGEIGLRAWTVEPTMYLIKDGCVLSKRTAEGSLPALVSILEAAFAPNNRFTDVLSNVQFVRAVVAVLDGLEPLYTQLAEQWKQWTIPADHLRELMLHYLHESLKPGFAGRFGEAWGVKSTRLPVRSDAQGTAHCPALGLGNIVGRDGAKHPLTEVPLFPMLRGAHVSMRELEDRIEKDGRVSYVPDTVAEQPWQDDMLRLSKRELSVLKRVFGKYRLRNEETRLAQRQLERKHLEKLVEPVRLGANLDVRPACGLRFEADDVQGELCLAYPPRSSFTAPWKVRLLRERRTISTRTLDLALPPGEAVVNHDALVPTLDWSDVRDDAKLARVRVAVCQAAHALVAFLARRFTLLALGRKASQRALLENALECLVPTRTLGQAYMRLVESFGGFEPADAEYARVVELLAWTELPVLDAALRRLLDEGVVPTAAELHRRLATDSAFGLTFAPLTFDSEPCSELFSGPVEPISPDADGPAQAFAALRKLSLYESSGREPVCLQDILQAFQKHRDVGFVDDQADCDPVEDRLVLYVVGGQVSFLQRLLGAEGLDHAGAEIRAARSYRRFQEQQAADSLTLAAGAVLVRRPLAVEGMEGEVGLAASGDRGSWLHVHKQRRQICTVEKFSRYGLVAIANDDRLTTSASYTEVVHDEHLARVVAACEAALPGLLRQLADLWPELAPERQVLAYRHVLDYVCGTCAAQFQAGQIAEDPLAAALVELPGLEGVSGRRYSLAELGQSEQLYDEVAFLPEPLEGAELTPDRRILLARGHMVAQLRQLFPSVRDYSEQWRDDQLVAGLRARSVGKLPTPENEPALARLQTVSPPWRGTLLLPDRDDAELSVAYGAHGYELGRASISDVFPCAGALLVSESKYRAAGGEITLEPTLLFTLEREAFRLYRKLCRRYPKLDEAGRSARRARHYLRGAAVALHHRLNDSGCTEEVRKRWRKLYNELAHLALFEVGAKLVNLKVVERDRPPELAALGLWDFDTELEPEPEPQAAPTVVPLPRLLADVGDEALQTAALADPSVERPGKGSTLLAWSEVSADSIVEAAEPPTEPPPAPLPAEPPLPDPREQLVGLLRQSLEEICSSKSEVLRHVDLRHIRFIHGRAREAVSCDLTGINLHEEHPAIAEALSLREPDPVLVIFLASALYTAVNIFLAEVTDDDEDAFHYLVAGHLLERRSGADLSPGTDD
ncbi:MAG: hypothetical protein ABI333_05335 [bacterium]